MLYQKKNHKALSFLSKCMLICSLLWIQSCSDDEDVPQNIDSQITFTNITPAMEVWNNVKISLGVSDDMGIASVEFLIDGVSIATLTQSPFTEVTWDASKANDGVHTVKVIVTDGSGNKTEKETTVTVKNTLLTVDIAANQLSSDARGFVFLSDENGNLIASTEYTNSNDIVLKSSAFMGTKFFLTEVLVTDDGGPKEVNLWTYPEIERGQAWKVVADSDRDPDTNAGKANLTLTNAVSNSIYDIISNASAQTTLDAASTTGSILLRTTPTSLYVTRRTQQSGTPLGYALFSNVVVGNNTLNLSQVNQPMSKLTATMPEEVSYASVYVKAYPTLNDYTNAYTLGTFTNGGSNSGIESFDIYYPGTAFAAYYSIIEMGGDDLSYYSGSHTSIFEVTEITNTVSFGFANEKLTYSATGDFAFISTAFETDNSYWSLILPEGSNKVVPALKLPDELKAFEIPAFGSPEGYEAYKFDGVDDYNDLKTFISTSSHSIDELFGEGKNFTEISYWNLPSAGGRSKTSNKKHALGTAFRK
ncbi:MAG TPA: Ig-like domain-containing protein [Chryseolinea sp.]